MKIIKLFVAAALMSMVAVPASTGFVSDAFAKGQKEQKKLTPEQQKVKDERKAARKAAKDMCSKGKDAAKDKDAIKKCVGEKMKAVNASLKAAKPAEKK